MNKDFENAYNACRLCARECGVNRSAGQIGYCKMTDTLMVSRAAPHMWEEPIISGERGSGTVFFSGCSLGCIYCQNSDISRGRSGVAISTERLADIFVELSVKGVHNINLVTPTHYVPHVISAVKEARERGLTLPIVYNTASYETEKTLEMLSDTVDVFLADLKYYRDKTAGEYSFAPDYPDVARIAIAKMVAMTGAPVIRDGIMLRGTVVRILLLPGHVAEAKLIVKHLYEAYGDKIYISLMNQYTPRGDLPSPLNRRVTSSEYSELVDYAIRLGVTNCFIQDDGTAEESFIPPFDNTGVLPRS